MISEFVQTRLRDAFPENTDVLTARAVREGLVLADDLMNSNEVLNNLIGRDLRGHVRRAGVMMKLHDFCTNGDLPFSATYARMPIGSWHFLEIKSKAVTAHVHKTDSAGAFPKDSPVRQIERLSNQPDLFAENNVVPFSKILGEGPFNAWLTLGTDDSGNVTHLNWRVPSSAEDVWLAATDILASAAKSIAAASAPSKAPNPKDKMRFKEHIESTIEREKTDKKESE